MVKIKQIFVSAKHLLYYFQRILPGHFLKKTGHLPGKMLFGCKL
jgi:hypothetical protein